MYIKNKNSGFTLIEVMIAMTLFTTIEKPLPSDR